MGAQRVQRFLLAVDREAGAAMAGVDIGQQRQAPQWSAWLWVSNTWRMDSISSARRLVTPVPQSIRVLSSIRKLVV